MQHSNTDSCILLKFYIKPQLFCRHFPSYDSCILLKFYIKPQLDGRRYWVHQVVSYWNSTSNHNYSVGKKDGPKVVSYWNSTSNHNFSGDFRKKERLYLIEILHQTTTGFQSVPRHRCCILLKFYIKPQLFSGLTLTLIGCILLKFYIKPQRFRRNRWWLSCCILLKFYIKPQPATIDSGSEIGCILLKFYIKPQPVSHQSIGLIVVSYWNSTSNHNRTVITMRQY